MNAPEWMYLIPEGALFNWRAHRKHLTTPYSLHWGPESPNIWHVKTINGEICNTCYEWIQLKESMENGSTINNLPLKDWKNLIAVMMTADDDDIDFKIDIL